MKTPGRLLDCRGLSSLSWSPRDGGTRGSVGAHEGEKPDLADHLILADADGPRLYRVVGTSHCYGVDPPNMWIARVEFVPAAEASQLFPEGPPARSPRCRP